MGMRRSRETIWKAFAVIQMRRMRGRENMVRWILEVELTKFAYGLGRGMKERESGMTPELLT